MMTGWTYGRANPCGRLGGVRCGGVGGKARVGRDMVAGEDRTLRGEDEVPAAEED